MSVQHPRWSEALGVRGSRRIPITSQTSWRNQVGVVPDTWKCRRRKRLSACSPRSPDCVCSPNILGRSLKSASGELLPRWGDLPRSTGSDHLCLSGHLFSRSKAARIPPGCVRLVSQLGYSGHGSSGDGAGLRASPEPTGYYSQMCFWVMSKTSRPPQDAAQTGVRGTFLRGTIKKVHR